MLHLIVAQLPRLCLHSPPFQCRACPCSHSVRLCLHAMSHEAFNCKSFAGVGEARSGRHRPNSCWWPLLWSLHGCQLVGTCTGSLCLWHCPQRCLQQAGPGNLHSVTSCMCTCDWAHCTHVYNVLCLVRIDCLCDMQVQTRNETSADWRPVTEAQLSCLPAHPRNALLFWQIRILSVAWVCRSQRS